MRVNGAEKGLRMEMSIDFDDEDQMTLFKDLFLTALQGLSFIEEGNLTNSKGESINSIEDARVSKNEFDKE